VSALLAQLVGSVQELSAQLHSKDAQIVVLAKQNQELGHRVAALEVVAAQQCLPSKTRSWVTALRRSRWWRNRFMHRANDQHRCAPTQVCTQTIPSSPPCVELEREQNKGDAPEWRFIMSFSAKYFEIIRTPAKTRFLARFRCKNRKKELLSIEFCWSGCS